MDVHVRLSTAAVLAHQPWFITLRSAQITRHCSRFSTGSRSFEASKQVHHWVPSCASLTNHQVPTWKLPNFYSKNLWETGPLSLPLGLLTLGKSPQSKVVLELWSIPYIYAFLYMYLRLCHGGLPAGNRTTGQRLNSDQQLFSGAVSYRPLKLDLLQGSCEYSNLWQFHGIKLEISWDYNNYNML